MFNKLLQYVKLPHIFFNRPIYISNYRYRKNQCITLITAINQISNESQIQFSLRTFQTRTYNFINISMCVLVVYISILHKNYLQISMRITFFFTTAIFIKVSYVHLSFPKVAGVKTIVYLKLRSPDAQPQNAKAYSTTYRTWNSSLNANNHLASPSRPLPST